MISKIKTDSVLFFDMDGTLIDTDYANYLSYKKAFELVKGTEFNINYDPTQRLTRSLLETVFSNLTEEELGMIVAEKERCYNDFLPETKLHKETVEILKRYCKTNRTVLVTNCRKDRALALLNYHGLTGMFSNLFFRQFGSNNEVINKFKNSILNLGISQELIIAFENEEFEIAEAMKAGIQSEKIIKIINP